MRLFSIASGSSGNCVYVGDGNTHLLIDVGISGKRIDAGLNQNGLKTADINGILITHEHSDHTSGLGVLARRYKIPIYATKETIGEIMRTKSLGAMEPELFIPILPDKEFRIEALTWQPFSISHDAANPVAYRIQNDKEEKVAVATDMGTYNEYIIQNLSGLKALLLEANHDVRMLETGGYPYSLKCRILGDRGHLSNELSGKLLSMILHDGLKHIILGHLSKENNYEKLAYETVKWEIAISENSYKGDDFPIQVARRDVPSPMILV